MSDLVPSPGNVRLVGPRGQVLPVELVYDGVHDGIHLWVAVTTAPAIPLAAAGWRLLVGVLPARTGIRVRVRDVGRA